MLEVDDLILISVDDHLIEPPDLFVNHLAAKYLDRAPKLVRNDEGSDVWTFGERRHGDRRAQRRRRPPQGGVRHGAAEPRRGAARLLRRPRAGEGHGRRRRAGLDELPVVPHLHRPHVRSATTSTCRSPSCGPTTTGTSTSGAAPTPAASSPWPCRPSGTPRRPPPRCAAAPTKGCHSLSFTENPAALGYPSFHDDYWDPVWQACVDTGTVLSIHLGSSGRLSIPAVDSPPDVMITLQPMNIQSAAADLLWSRVIKNYPDLRIALSEGGTGWIPYFLDRVDRTYEMHRAWTQQDFGGRLPERGVPRALPHLLHQRPGRRRAARRRSASTTCAGRPTTRTATRCGPTAPEELHAVFAANDVPDDEIAQDDPRERHALVLVRPLRPRAEGGGDGRRPAGQGRRPRRVGHVAQHPGAHAPTRSSRASARRARRAVAAAGAVSTGDARDAKRQMSLVGFMQAGNTTVYAGLVAPPRHRARLPRRRLLPEARAHPRRGLLRHDVLRRPPGHARHLRRLGGRGRAPRAPGR